MTLNMADNDNKPYSILIAALGGEGGGVLADWLVQCALEQGLPVQATSVPGVAQRTGATSYYIEMLRAPLAEGAAPPVLALTPVPGHVDVVIASEMLEAARVMERGFVTPSRTALLSSTSRVYTTFEKMHMADGRYDTQRMQQAARTLARHAVLFDMEAIAVQSGTVISAVMFGALAGAGVLPWPRSVCEDAIRSSGKGVAASLEGFARAFDAAALGAPAPEAAVQPEAAKVLADAVTTGLPLIVRDAWAARMVSWPAGVQLLAVHGALRCRDYQDDAYAERFLTGVEQLCSAPTTTAANEALEEAVRHLALWMCFEDVIRVADLKSRRSRTLRVRGEAQAKADDIVRITEHFKPGIDEIAAVLPRSIGARLMALAEKRGWKAAHVGLHIRSTSLWGYLMLRFLARLRPWRPSSLRFAQEHEALRAWLDAVRHVLPLSPKLALAMAGLPQVLKGYGDTQVRGRQNYARLWAAHVTPVLGGHVDVETAAKDLQAAIRATLADPEGKLNAAAPREIVAQPIHWMPRERENTITQQT
jgi:indolepyruvate ferredoxin oxidoreductase beta subunit